MGYSIGDIVKNDKSETCIILATKTTPLTSDLLNSLNGEILIKEIEELAKRKVYVTAGFDYTIGKIKSFEGKYCLIDFSRFFDVFKDDISR